SVITGGTLQPRPTTRPRISVPSVVGLAARRRRDPAGAEERALLAVQDQVSHVRQAIFVADAAWLPVDIAEVQRRVSRAGVVHEHQLLAKGVLEVADVT